MKGYYHMKDRYWKKISSIPFDYANQESIIEIPAVIKNTYKETKEIPDCCNTIRVNKTLLDFNY